MTNTKNIVIYGAGGLGRGIADLIDVINKKHSEWNLLGFIDDNEQADKINGLKVLGGLDYLFKYGDELNVVLAFGSPKVKMNLHNKLKMYENIMFPNIIHPSVEIPQNSKLGKGNVISKGVTISANIEIGDFNLIHYNCSIGHDVSIGNYNSVFPLTALSGFVKLHDCIEMGTNAAVIPNIKIGSNAVIGAGSTIIENVQEKSIVVGTPGRKI